MIDVFDFAVLGHDQQSTSAVLDFHCERAVGMCLSGADQTKRKPIRRGVSTAVRYTFHKSQNNARLSFGSSRQQVLNTVPDLPERSLEELHDDLSKLFDEDTILAGHSVENDLKYLQMYYPYIIDTSIIFNVSGARIEKASLQKLYAIFFG